MIPGSDSLYWVLRYPIIMSVSHSTKPCVLSLPYNHFYEHLRGENTISGVLGLDWYPTIDCISLTFNLGIQIFSIYEVYFIPCWNIPACVVIENNSTMEHVFFLRTTFVNVEPYWKSSLVVLQWDPMTREHVPFLDLILLLITGMILIFSMDSCSPFLPSPLQFHYSIRVR